MSSAVVLPDPAMPTISSTARPDEHTASTAWRCGGVGPGGGGGGGWGHPPPRAGGLDQSGFEPVHAPADDFEFGVPARHQLLDPGEPLRRPRGPGRDGAGVVASIAPL